MSDSVMSNAGKVGENIGEAAVLAAEGVVVVTAVLVAEVVAEANHTHVPHPTVHRAVENAHKWTTKNITPGARKLGKEVAETAVEAGTAVVKTLKEIFG